MKKLIVLAAAALMAAGAQAAYKDGTYTGEGKGRESQIQVQVDVKGGKVAAVKVLKHGETEMIFAAAAETLCPAIVAKNGVAPRSRAMASRPPSRTPCPRPSNDFVRTLVTGIR